MVIKREFFAGLLYNRATRNKRHKKVLFYTLPPLFVILSLQVVMLTSLQGPPSSDETCSPIRQNSGNQILLTNSKSLIEVFSSATFFEKRFLENSMVFIDRDWLSIFSHHFYDKHLKDCFVAHQIESIYMLCMSLQDRKGERGKRGRGKMERFTISLLSTARLTVCRGDSLASILANFCVGGALVFRPICP